MSKFRYFDLVLISLSLCLNLLLGSDCKTTVYLSILLHNETSIHPSIHHIAYLCVLCQYLSMADLENPYRGNISYKKG
ncbi:hypothetical protein Hanom_Chr09g00781801 [Helianthus anomalus]